jgi:RNA polymerase sigma-70 factor (ECF subfamily)
MKMKNFANTGRMKKAGPTLTPDGKTLVGGKCECGKACGNREGSGGFCRCSHHAGEYREIAELRGEFRTEQLRRDLDSLWAGPDRSQLTDFAFSLAKNLPEAEELVQAACFRAFRYSAIYDARRPLLGWLKTILRNSFCDGIRHSRLNVSLDVESDTGDGITLGESLTAPDVPVEVLMERERGTAALLQAMAELPKAVRRPVSLCDFEGLSYDAAAVRLGIPVGTVRSRLARGRRLLRENIFCLTDSVNGGMYDRALQPV